MKGAAPNMIAKLLPANRIAAIITWLTALGALIASIAGTFPQSWQNDALAITALITKLVLTLHFMSGSQKFDALPAQSAAPAPAAAPDAPAAVSVDGILQEIATVDQATAAVQVTGGTPASAVSAGLAPTPMPEQVTGA